MIISCIVAIDKNNVIGKDNKMPWHLSSDLKYFRKTTTGHCIIMGRKNFESIGKPLPSRTNIIVTRNKSYFHSACIIADSIEKALTSAFELNESEVFITGGAEIYRQTIDYWDKLYLTEIDAEYSGDVFFPEIDLSQWQLISDTTVEISDENKHKLNFKVYERINGL